MKYYFKDLKEMNASIDDNIARLNVPITNSNGESVVQLIGIDGKPTEDDSIFNNRQSIFDNFKQNYDAYIANITSTSIEDFAKRNSIALITESATYRKCVELFWDNFKDAEANLKSIENLKTKVAAGDTSVDSEFLTPYERANRIVNETYDIAFDLKAYYQAAQKKSAGARFISMMLGFIEEGEDFFNNPQHFEDTYTPDLDDMYKAFKELHSKLKHNARHELQDMIT